jgi:hypothetical protein
VGAGVKMQQLINKLAVALLIGFLGCSSVKMIEQDSEEGQLRFTIKQGGNASDTVYHGIYTIWYPNGMKKLEVTYKNGKKQGMETLWDPHGTKIRETWYNNGKKNGNESYWDSRGNLKKTIAFRNDLQNGMEVTFSANGKKLKEEFYKAGLKEGVEKVTMRMEDWFTRFFTGKAKSMEKNPFLITLKGESLP